jgi:hypothetical protein
MLALGLSPLIPQEMQLYYFRFLNGGRWISTMLNAIKYATKKHSCCNEF